LTPPDIARAHALQAKLLEVFSPTLFQAPPASHMACTDSLADAWLNLVIPAAMASPPPLLTSAESVPGMEEDEVTRLSRHIDLGRPLESLRALEEVDWEAQGVCASCTAQRRQECRDDRQAIWDRLPGWLNLEP
jgi:hypothetical protein